MLLHEQKGDMVAADAMYARGSAANPEDVDRLFNWATLKRDGLGDAAAANVLIDQVRAPSGWREWSWRAHNGGGGKAPPSL